MIINRREFLGTTAAAALASGMSLAADPKPLKFQLGLVSYNVAAGWDLPTVLRICKATGIAAVECRTTHKHGVEPTLSADARKDVKKMFTDSGIRFWGCGSVCEFHSADPAVVKKHIEDCKKFVDLVKDLGGVGVKVRPNGVPKGGTVEKTMEQIGKALIECGRAAKDAGVEIWVEVHGAVTQIPANMKSIMEHCGHESVGITWNSNAADVENGSVAKSFEMLKKWIRSCHINDLENDASGKYPYKELFRLLREQAYDRYTLIEVGKTYEPQSGEEFLAKYKKLWTELAKG